MTHFYKVESLNFIYAYFNNTVTFPFIVLLYLATQIFRHIIKEFILVVARFSWAKWTKSKSHLMAIFPGLELAVESSILLLPTPLAKQKYSHSKLD